MGIFPSEFKREIRNISDIENDIEKYKDNDKKLIELYEERLDIDNTSEKYVIDYLVKLRDMIPKDKDHFSRLSVKNKPLEDLSNEQDELTNFKTKLEIYKFCVSDENYEIYFSEYPRKNSKQNIFYLLELLQQDLNNDVYILKRKEFFDKLLKLSEREDKYPLKFTKIIDWKNSELYIHNIYLLLLTKIVKYGKICSEVAKNKNSTESICYKYYDNLLKKEKDEKKRLELLEIIYNINFFEGDFFGTYLKNLGNFLREIKTSLDNKFRNNSLNSKLDQNTFEDFIQFLNSYDFNKYDEKYANIWNDNLTEINVEDLRNKIELCNSFERDNNISYELKDEKILIMKKNNVKIYEINNIQNYNITKLLHDLSNSTKPFDLEYYTNKHLKPRHYGTDLFISKKKDIWKQLIISIINSKAVKEAVESAFNNKEYTKLLSDQKLISDIIDNISFFIYDTNFSGCTNSNSLKIYEFGLFEKNDNKSVSLSFFYSFNVTTNIHEICGHFNLRYQTFNSLDSSYESPKINDNEKYLYSSYAIERKKESGESIEIALFGKRIRQLNIKEALFLLEPINYKNGKDEFIYNFNNCNIKEIKDIISQETNQSYLIPLGINIEKIPKNYADIHSIKSNITKSDNENEIIQESLPRHPPEFYVEVKDLQFMRDIILTANKIIKEFEKK